MLKSLDRRRGDVDHSSGFFRRLLPLWRVVPPAAAAPPRLFDEAYASWPRRSGDVPGRRRARTAWPDRSRCCLKSTIRSGSLSPGGGMVMTQNVTLRMIGGHGSRRSLMPPYQNDLGRRFQPVTCILRGPEGVENCLANRQRGPDFDWITAAICRWPDAADEIRRAIQVQRGVLPINEGKAGVRLKRTSWPARPSRRRRTRHRARTRKSRAVQQSRWATRGPSWPQPAPTSA